MHEHLVSLMTAGRVVLVPGMSVGPYATATGWCGYAVIVGLTPTPFESARAAAEWFCTLVDHATVQAAIQRVMEEELDASTTGVAVSSLSLSAGESRLSRDAAGAGDHPAARAG